MKNALAFAALLFAVPSVAAAEEPVTVRVETTGLDLLSIEGQQRVETRMTAGVRRACATGMRGIEASRIEAECRKHLGKAASHKVTQAIASAKKRRLAEASAEGAKTRPDA